MRSMPRWTAIGTLPVVSGVLLGLNALYIILVAFGNITDFDVNQRFVQHVLAMDTTNLGQPPGTGLDSNVMWRAFNSATLQNAVYVGIVIWELAAGVVLAASLVMDVVGSHRLQAIRPSPILHWTADDRAAVLRRIH